MPRKKKTVNKKTSANKTLSKADFIRSMSADVPVKQVIAEAKKVGMTVSENHVYGVRGEAKKAAKKKTTAKPAAEVSKAMRRAKATRRRKATSKRKPKVTTSKKAFVLGYPLDMPAAEIVAAARAAGIALTTKYIYNIRGAASAAKKVKSTRKPTATSAPKPVVSAAPRTGSPEEKFVDLVLDIGLVRAAELLGMIRERVRGLRLA